MYRIKQKIKQLRKLIRWIPILWNDRDWDYYFVYEMLKQKLIDTEKYIRKDGVHMFNNKDADSILKAIDMIEKVQTEYHLDKYLSEATEWTAEGIDKATKDHDKAKRELFKYLNNNIEKWWD
jgi:hypothetical protein